LSFRGAMAGEGTHSALLSELKKTRDYSNNTPYCICPKCGNIENGNIPPNCPVCGLSGNGYKTIL